jgi:hypothetical protein
MWQNKYLAIKTCFLNLNCTLIIIYVAIITLGKKSRFVASVYNCFLVVKVTFYDWLSFSLVQQFACNNQLHVIWFYDDITQI